MNFEISRTKESEEKQYVLSEFQDFEESDLSHFDMRSIPPEQLLKTTFYTKTKWPTPDRLPEGFSPERVMNEAKNPGLGLKELHQQGIDGRGVVVAIIDQKPRQTHEEYRGKIREYTEYGEAVNEPVSLHGAAVASVLAGKECGVAPGVQIVYCAHPSGAREFVEKTRALNDLRDRNKRVGADEKIRIVSCSFGYDEDKPELGMEEWIEAIAKAQEEGIIFVDTAHNFGLRFAGGGSCENKEDPDAYYPWLWLQDKKISENTLRQTIVVPSDYRSMASFTGDNEYRYEGRGGLSWSVPYLSGIIALALQVNPGLTSEQVREIIEESAIVNKQGLRLINPQGIVARAKESVVDED